MSHLYRLNEPHPYLVHGEHLIATIRDIDRFGRLVLEFLDGSQEAFGFKEVGYLFN
jgi:hypothetical protein